MAELQPILLSGQIKEINLDGTQIKQTLDGFGKGLPLAKIPASDANPDTLFFNMDNARVCYKSANGIVFKLKMELVP